MKIYDVSMMIEPSMMVYKKKEEKKPQFKVDNHLDEEGSYETTLSFNLHTGTHLDMPLHMISGGKSLDQFDLSKVITECKVYDLTALKRDYISRDDLDDLAINEGDFILFKTKNSFDQSFNFEFIYLDQSAADYLKNKKVKGVGIDGLGIERAQAGHPTHKLLLAEDIVIMEGLRLADVEEGIYQLVALPLKIKGVEAGPVRAVLIEY